MGFKKNMKGEAPPVQAPKVETVSAGESEHAAKRSLLEEQRRRPAVFKALFEYRKVILAHRCMNPACG